MCYRFLLLLLPFSFPHFEAILCVSVFEWLLIFCMFHFYFDCVCVSAFSICFAFLLQFHVFVLVPVKTKYPRPLHPLPYNECCGLFFFSSLTPLNSSCTIANIHILYGNMHTLI